MRKYFSNYDYTYVNNILLYKKFINLALDKKETLDSSIIDNNFNEAEKDVLGELIKNQSIYNKYNRDYGRILNDGRLHEEDMRLEIQADLLLILLKPITQNNPNIEHINQSIEHCLGVITYAILLEDNALNKLTTILKGPTNEILFKNQDYVSRTPYKNFLHKLSEHIDIFNNAKYSYFSLIIEETNHKYLSLWMKLNYMPYNLNAYGISWADSLVNNKKYIELENVLNIMTNNLLKQINPVQGCMSTHIPDQIDLTLMYQNILFINDYINKLPSISDKLQNKINKLFSHKTTIKYKSLFANHCHSEFSKSILRNTMIILSNKNTEKCKNIGLLYYLDKDYPYLIQLKLKNMDTVFNIRMILIRDDFDTTTYNLLEILSDKNMNSEIALTIRAINKAFSATIDKNEFNFTDYSNCFKILNFLSTNYNGPSDIADECCITLTKFIAIYNTLINVNTNEFSFNNDINFFIINNLQKFVNQSYEPYGQSNRNFNDFTYNMLNKNKNTFEKLTDQINGALHKLELIYATNNTAENNDNNNIVEIIDIDAFISSGNLEIIKPQTLKMAS